MHPNALQATAEAGRLTAMPAQQTATQAVVKWALEGARMYATQTAATGDALVAQAAAQDNSWPSSAGSPLSRRKGWAGSALPDSHLADEEVKRWQPLTTAFETKKWR